MRRVVIVGRGGAGKSRLARDLSARSGLPCVELDKEFWNSELEPLQPGQWAQRQEALAQRPCWIMDGDLGPHDVLEPRLRRADTVVIVDLPLWICVVRTLRRGRERRDFWRWMHRWRHVSLPWLLQEIDRHAPKAKIVILTDRRAVDRWLRAQCS